MALALSAPHVAFDPSFDGPSPHPQNHSYCQVSHHLRVRFKAPFRARILPVNAPSGLLLPILLSICESIRILTNMRTLTSLAVCVIMALSAFPPTITSEPGGRDAGHQVLLDTIDRTVEISKDGRYFLTIGPDHMIHEMALPSFETGMTTDTLTALGRVPEWLRADLAKKLKELSEATLSWGPNGRCAIADFDGDTDVDVIAGGQYMSLGFYRNGGTAYEPVLLNDQSPQFTWSGPNDTAPMLSPSAGDLDKDGRMDLALGVDGAVDLLFNKEEGWTRTSAGVSVPVPAGPALGDMDGDGDADMLVGDGNGKVQYYENTGNATNPRFAKTASALLFSAIAVVPGPAAPAVADLNGDGDLDIAVGAGNGAVHCFQNIGTATVPAWAPDDPSVFAGVQVAASAAPSFADLNGDNRTDLVVGGAGGPFSLFNNIGTSVDPKYQTWAFYGYTPEIGYYDPASHLMMLNYGIAKGYVDAINSIEPKCVDELAFSIAHTAKEALMASHPELYMENARDIYGNDVYLDYVRIVDYDDYSTTRYMINDSGSLKEVELPRDIYYWYIVHPKITDEIPDYIDPSVPSGSPGEGAAPPVGKFWRSYLFSNADTQYPPDPPTDDNGDGVPDYCYPKDSSPPLLRDILLGIKTLWDGVAYGAPGGYDNSGHNNSRPFGWKDHAIEAVSNWVELTLPLNERESGDGERPIQPVRIATTHNGNCGELQDLTIAAARSALIPAGGANLLSEDHVWIEFYDRGWHQWDNYWSDGGSVIDNYMNYWYGWGERGGSGISKWRGDDYAFEVTEKYLPLSIQSNVTVTVKDSAGYPVDGARVLMMSHWLTEESTPVEGVSAPYPAIWNFTDCQGRATFVLAHNNFTIKVISRLGSAFENKTYISTGQNYSFNFTLPGRLPEPAPQLTSYPSQGLSLLVDTRFEVLSGEQRPPNPETSTTTVQPVKSATLDFFICNAVNFSRYLSGEPTGAPENMNDIDDLAYLSGGLPPDVTWVVCLSNKDTLETSKTVHLNITVKLLYRDPEVKIASPTVDSINDGNQPLSVSGKFAVCGTHASFFITVDADPYINMTSGLDMTNRTWKWEANMRSYSSGPHILWAKVVDELGYERFDSVRIILDRQAPRVDIDAPVYGAVYELESHIDLRGRATDDVGIRTLMYRVDGGRYNDLPLCGTAWSMVLPSGGLGGGLHTVEAKATDFAGRSSNVTVAFDVRDGNAPDVKILAPEALASFEVGTVVTLKGTARDTSGIGTLTLSIEGNSVNLKPYLGSDGSWTYGFATEGLTETGDVPFTVLAVDTVGNRASAARTFRLVDTAPPVVEVTTPSTGAISLVGDRINLTGTATDNIGVVRVEASLGGTGWKSITGSLNDGQFKAYFETGDKAPGRYNLTVRAMDASGNIGTAQIHINLDTVLVVKPPAKKPESKFIPGLELPMLFSALAIMLIVMQRRRRAA